MVVFKCKICGGTIEPSEGGIGICDSCGTKQTISNTNDEKKMNLLDRANHFRMLNEFDKALAIYEQVLAEDTNDSDIYYAIALCRYGITYVDDPTTKKKIPTINRMQNKMFTSDPDYVMAINKASSGQSSLYEEEGKYIDKVQTGIMDITKNEKPYDVFICYKETDDTTKERTRDSVLANDLYHGLTNEGFKVFFARITLEGKLGTAYEPYIFSALNSSKVMVVLGTKREYFNAVWVKNEWSRFLSLKNEGGDKTLIPAYKDMDPYDLPDEFSNLQALDMSKLGFMQDLIRGIKKIVNKNTGAMSNPIPIPNNATVDQLLKRVRVFLSDGEFNNANKYCEKALDIDAENSDIYLCKVMIDYKCRSEQALERIEEDINSSNNYQKALRYASAEQKKKLIEIRSECLYRKAKKNIEGHRYGAAIAILEKIAGYKDSDILKKNCQEYIESMLKKQAEEKRRQEEERKERQKREEEERKERQKKEEEERKKREEENRIRLEEAKKVAARRIKRIVPIVLVVSTIAAISVKIISDNQWNKYFDTEIKKYNSSYRILDKRPFKSLSKDQQSRLIDKLIDEFQTGDVSEYIDLKDLKSEQKDKIYEKNRSLILHSENHYSWQWKEIPTTLEKMGYYKDSKELISKLKNIERIDNEIKAIIGRSYSASNFREFIKIFEPPSNGPIHASRVPSDFYTKFKELLDILDRDYYNLGSDKKTIKMIMYLLSRGYDLDKYLDYNNRKFDKKKFCDSIKNTQVSNVLKRTLSQYGVQFGDLPKNFKISEDDPIYWDVLVREQDRALLILNPYYDYLTLSLYVNASDFLEAYENLLFNQEEREMIINQEINGREYGLFLLDKELVASLTGSDSIVENRYISEQFKGSWLMNDNELYALNDDKGVVKAQYDTYCSTLPAVWVKLN